MKNIYCEKENNTYKTYSFVGSGLMPLFLALSPNFNLFLFSLLILPFAVFIIILCKVISPANKTITTIFCAIIAFFALFFVIGSLLFGMLLSLWQ